MTCLLMSCSSVEQSKQGASKQSIGTAIGATAGATLGLSMSEDPRQQAISVALLGALGAGFGNVVGKSLDQRDQRLIANAAEQALTYAPSGTKISWRNPDSGNYGYVEPIKTWQPKSRRYCREYRTQIIVEGKEQTGYGIACRDQGDQEWRMVTTAE